MISFPLNYFLRVIIIRTQWKLFKIMFEYILNLQNNNTNLLIKI